MGTFEPLSTLKNTINSLFVNREPWQIVTITTTTVLTTVWLYEFIFEGESVVVKSKKTFFKLLKKIPAVKNKIDSEMSKYEESFKKDVEMKHRGVPAIPRLPNGRMTSEEIVKTAHDYLGIGTVKWKEGKVSGGIYMWDENLVKMTTEIFGISSYTNPLHADVFPGLNKMEAEVVRMTADLFHGGPETCGSMTTGGTESIIMACKAYRDRAYDRGIKRPEMVIPSTAHPAFDKAAQYLGILVRLIPVDRITYKVDLKAMRRAINSRTCMIVGSAPNFPYGTMDDIPNIAALGLKYKVPVHVDACLGGFLIVFMEDAGYSLPLFDFRLEGVTSISADTHKYGFAPKGSSVILYRSTAYKHYQYTVTTDWPGGVYGSPTVSGSRSGGMIMVCWATMLYFGRKSYIEYTKSIVDTAKYIESKLRTIPNIFVFGTPATSVIAIGSNDFDIFLLADVLLKYGWHLNQLQFPSGIHIAITHLHTKPGVADSFVNDVEREISTFMKNPRKPLEGKMAIYGVAQSLPDRSLVKDITKYFIDSMYMIDNKAEINKSAANGKTA